MQIYGQKGGTGGHNSNSASTYVEARPQPTDVMTQAVPCNSVNCAETVYDRHSADDVLDHEVRAK